VRAVNGLHETGLDGRKLTKCTKHPIIDFAGDGSIARHGERRLDRCRPPWPHPRHTAGLQLSDDFVQTSRFSATGAGGLSSNLQTRHGRPGPHSHSWRRWPDPDYVAPVRPRRLGQAARRSPLRAGPRGCQATIRPARPQLCAILAPWLPTNCGGRFSTKARRPGSFLRTGSAADLRSLSNEAQ
jgi:hypothetical protein